jgi:hypothetical protein
VRKLFALILIFAAATARADDGPALPAWLAGCWQHAEGSDWTEECWTAPHGGLMVGSGHSGSGERVASYEFMRIEQGDRGPVFYGAPRGTGWTPFPSAPDAEGGATFLNVEHDYPQRIRYWREGDLLHAEISLADGTQAERWTYRRASASN